MGVASYRSVKKYFVAKTESIQWRVFTKLTFITCETNYCCIIMSRNTTIIGKKELFEQSMNRVKFALDRSFFSNREPNSRPPKIRVIFYDEVSIVDSMRLGHGINFFLWNRGRFLGASTKVIHRCQVLFNQASRNCVRARVYTERSL